MTNAKSSSSVVIYVLSSGEKVRANSPEELITYMRENTGLGMDDPSESLDTYMFRVSERVLLSIQQVVRIDSPENFVSDLQKCGMITHAIMAN